MQTKTILDIPIYQKTCQLYKLLYSCHGAIPKTQLYTLWQKTESITIDILEAILDTSYVYGDARIKILFKISAKLDLLKTFIRLSRETNSISQAKYLEIQNLMQEIGKMIGGWLKMSKLSPKSSSPSHENEMEKNV